MQLFKRIELWILLILLVAGLAFVFTSHPKDNDAGPDTVSAASEESALKVHRCVLKRDYGNAQLELEVKVRNDSPATLVLQSPAAKLLGAKGREIPSFFLPFQAQPEVPAKATQEVQLRYWLDAADLAGPLSLEVQGKAVEVKSSKPFDLNSVENSKEKAFTPSEW